MSVAVLVGIATDLSDSEEVGVALALPLLMARVVANDAYDTLAANDLALLTNLLD